MKRSILLFILLSFALINESSAQDYQSYRSDRIYSYDQILHLGFSSVTLNGADSIFHTHNNIWRGHNRSCWNTQDGSFMGKKIIIGQNGFDLFFNKKNDTIAINRFAQLNDTWILYNGDTMIIEAKIIRHDTMQFLGQVDSVKSIELTVYDTSMSPITSHWISTNSQILLLSKNYGLIKAPMFRLFPNTIYDILFSDGFSSSGYPITAYAMDVIGITNPNLGFHDLTTYDIFDFQIGDELHIREYRDDGFGGYYGDWRFTEVKTRINYLDRRDYLPDSIVYEIQVRSRKNEGWVDSSSSIYSERIRKQRIVPNMAVDQPSETYWGGKRFYLSDDGKEKILSDEHSSLSDSKCSSLSFFDGCTSTMEYRKGLGGPYHWCINTISAQEETSRTLVYYKKGDTESGTPFTDVGITESSKQKRIALYPNPNRGQFTLETDPKISEGSLFIYNASDQMVYRTQFGATQNQFKRTIQLDQKPGMYFVKLFIEDDTYYHKLIITE